MTVLEFFLLLVIAGVCGATAQALVGFSRGGCLASISLGFIGALLGGWIATEMGLPVLFAVSVGGGSFPVIWSVMGAALFAAGLSLLSRSRRT